MIKKILIMLGFVFSLPDLCLANPPRPSPGDVRTSDLWAGNVKIEMSASDSFPCGNDLRTPNTNFPFIYDDQIRSRLNHIQVCVEVWMRGVTDAGSNVDVSLINVEVIYQMDGKRVSKKMTPLNRIGNNQIFGWDLNNNIDPFLANSGMGGIMYGLLPDSKTVLWEDTEWALASVPLDFFFTVNGIPLVSPTLGHFVLDFIGQARKTHIVQGQIPKILDVEISCQSGLTVGTTANGFLIEIFDVESANNLLKTFSASNRFQGTVIRNIAEPKTSVALPFLVRDPKHENGNYLFQVGPRTSVVKVVQEGETATVQVKTGLLPETQLIEWSQSFDDCGPRLAD